MLAFLRAATDLGPVISFYRATGTDDHPSFLGLFSEHIINCAKVMLGTGMIVMYAYSIEFFTAWYSGHHFEQFVFRNRPAGKLVSPPWAPRVGPISSTMSP